jgi:hypothetical protein
MASYADVVWNASQYKLNEMMNMPEFKAKPSAALSIFMKNTNFLVPASERERMWNQKPSDTTAVTLKTLDKQSITTGSARAHDHTGSINDGSTATASYTTYSADFKYSIKQADRHVFSLGEEIAAQIRSAAIALNSSIETALVSSLDTNRSQSVISLTPQSGTWDATNYWFGVANSEDDFYPQRIQAFMYEQYYTGNFDVLNNIGAAIRFAQIAQQGQGNQTNLGWQIPGLNSVTSTAFANETGYNYMSYIVPEGTIGILPWIPKANREGFGDPFQNGGGYSTMMDPLGSGLEFAVHQYATGSDTSSAGGEVQDVTVQVELSVDLAPIYAPMSTANATPVYKTGLLQ